MLNLNDKNEYVDNIVDSDATSANTPNTLVQRDANGNFSAGTITANLNGTASNASLLSNMSATNANTPSTIVQRDANGNFSAGTITATLNGNASTATTASNSNQLQGMTATNNNTASTIVQRDANGNFSAGTITANLNGTASNASQLSNMSATNANTPSTIVQRDANGNFSAGTITATLNGNASTATELSNPITLTLSGAVSGSTTLQGNGQTATITTTLNSGGSGYLLYRDDTQVSTDANWTDVTMKTFRFVQSTANPISTLNVCVTAWETGSDAPQTITVYVNISGESNVTVGSTTNTTETLLTTTGIPVPSTNGIYTFSLIIYGSITSYLTAYTKLLEVYAL